MVTSVLRVLQLMEEVEADLEAAYTQLTAIYTDDPDAARLFSQLARDEHAHVQTVQQQRRVIRDNAYPMRDVEVDTNHILQVIATVANLRQAAAVPPPRLREVLLSLLEIEESASESHLRLLLAAADPEVGPLLEQLGQADREHATLLRGFAASRGFLPAMT